MEATNKLTLTIHQNCASASSGKEEQNRASLRGGVVRRMLMLRLTNGEECKP